MKEGEQLEDELPVVFVVSASLIIKSNSESREFRPLSL